MSAKVLDVTGTIREGMWNYEPPFPRFRMAPLPPVPWAGAPVLCETFDGLHSQTGTYLETPAHFLGADKAPMVDDLEIGRLVAIPAVVLHLERAAGPLATGRGRAPIAAEDLERAAGSQPIPPGCALLVSTGWGRHWMDAAYLSDSPYFRASAMAWLLERKPFLLGSDFARWENLEHREGFFPDFYASGCLMLGPLVDLDKWDSDRASLTALPLRIPGTSCVPCRAVLVEEDAP